MCTQPIKVMNPTKAYKEGVTKATITVPCGHCDECREYQSQDWFLRTWAEIQRYNRTGGKVVFVTLTYCNECLPRFTTYIRYPEPLWINGKLEEGKTYSFPCFSKKDKNRFFNLMRTYALRRWKHTGDIDKGELPIRYIWCCEYGKDGRFSKRPHYHVLLFLPKEIMAHLNSANKVKIWVKHFWPFGFVRWSKMPPKGPGIFVDKEFAAEYCSKYCCKDIAFYDQPQVNEFLLDKDGKIIKERKELCKDKLPQHWQSLHYGEQLTEVYDTIEKLDKGHNFNFKTDIDKGKTRKHKAPRYIERKLLYDKDPNDKTRFLLNDYGKTVKTEIFWNKITKYANQIEKFKDESYIKTLIDDNDVKELFEVYDLRNTKQVCQLIREKLELHNRDSKQIKERCIEIALYENVWSGKYYDKYTYGKKPIIDLDNLNHEEFKNESKEMYIATLCANDNPDYFVEEGYFKQMNDDDRNAMQYWDEANRFRGFAEAINICSKCLNKHSERLNRLYLEDRDRRKQLNREIYDKT